MKISQLWSTTGQIYLISVKNLCAVSLNPPTAGYVSRLVQQAEGVQILRFLGFFKTRSVLTLLVPAHFIKPETEQLGTSLKAHFLTAGR